MVTSEPIEILPERHLWVFTAMFHSLDPVRMAQIMDSTNLMAVNAVTCYFCHQLWSPTIGSKCTEVSWDKIKVFQTPPEMK
jgi:hypothetical protein